MTAPDVVVRGLTITGSGSDHEGIDSGVQLKQTATRAVVENNVLIGNLYGVDIHGAKDSRVSGNRVEGRLDRRMNDRGNGIYVWNAPGSKVTGNDIRWGRDGIFVNVSTDNEFIGNRFRERLMAVQEKYPAVVGDVRAERGAMIAMADISSVGHCASHCARMKSTWSFIIFFT